MEHLLQKNTNIFDDLQLWTTILGLLENKVKKLHWGLCFNPNSSFVKPQCESYSLTLKYTYTTLLHQKIISEIATQIKISLDESPLRS